jgi:membrane protease YdiL (CAAX protease family)
VTKNPFAKAVGFLALSAVAVLVYLFLLSVFRGKLGAFSATLPALVVALAALVLNWRFLRSDGQTLAVLGFGAPRLRVLEIAIGFVAGALVVGMWAVVLWAVLAASWKMANPFNSTIAIGAFTFIIFNNAGEELLYRGYLFLLLARSYGRAVAVIFTCGLFTLLHIQGGVPWPNAVAGVLTSALLYAALFVRRQSVPLVLAFHVAMNVMQELIGIRISGLTLFTPIYSEKVSATQSNTVLVLTAFINTALALAVFLSGRSAKANAVEPS